MDKISTLKRGQLQPKYSERLMVSLIPNHRISARTCVVGILLGLGLGSDAFSVLRTTPISRPGGNEMPRRCPQSISGVHRPSPNHKGLKLKRGGDIGKMTCTVNEFCSCDGDIGSRPGCVGKVSLESSEEYVTCRD